MPTYEYACEACGHRFEELQSFSEAALEEMPAMQENKLERLIGTGRRDFVQGLRFLPDRLSQ